LHHNTSHFSSTNHVLSVEANFNSLDQREWHGILASLGLGAPRPATLVDYRDGRGVARAGSLFDGSEYYSGMWIIDADSREHAEVFARQGSLACNRAVELRPFL
jgi:hypothetical protein